MFFCIPTSPLLEFFRCSENKIPYLLISCQLSLPSDVSFTVQFPDVLFPVEIIEPTRSPGHQTHFVLVGFPRECSESFYFIDIYFVKSWSGIYDLFTLRP